VTCVEVRGRLTEHSLGLLSAVDARDVERHLGWCAGCRKESAELQEGASMMALALPPADPPMSLESRVVGRIASAAGTNRLPSRNRIRLLVAATMAAAMIAVGAVGWAVAERRHARDVREASLEEIMKTERFRDLLTSLEANPLQAKLFPILDARGSGRVVIYSSPEASDLILASVSVLEPQGPRYTIELKDRAGKVLSGGALMRNNNGILIFYEESGKNLSRGSSVTVLDDSGRPVMTGMVQPSAEN
jgi:hypothetical protein